MSQFITTITQCPRRGCDLTLPNALEEYTPGKFRCVVCRQTEDRDRRRRKREHATHCVNGHEYSEQNTRTYVGRDGYRIRVCKICHKAGTMKATRRKREANGCKARMLSDPNLETVLDLWDEYTLRSATHMERSEVLAKIRKLQGNTGARGEGLAVPRAPRVALSSG